VEVRGGGLDFDYPRFVHTVLVDMRARLAASEQPDRVFKATLAAAREAGLVGRRRVVDSTAWFDAVATMDTDVDPLSDPGGPRGVRLMGERELRAVLARDDDYRSVGKPVCDWEDRQAREELVDALARDARAVLTVLDGRQLEPALAKAGELLATVVGQDLETGEDGRFRIARKVAKDRVISTVDPDARRGHKTAARGFDRYKGHVTIDPDSELIVATGVTAGVHSRADVTTRKATHSSAAATAPEEQGHGWRAERSSGGLPGGVRRGSVLRRGLHLRLGADRSPRGKTRERRPAVSRPRRRPRRLQPSTTINSLPPRTRTGTLPASVVRTAAPS